MSLSDKQMFCKNCKHWGLPAWSERSMAEQERLRDQRECNVPNPMFLSFGEGIVMEGVATKPDFGCVQFERR